MRNVTVCTVKKSIAAMSLRWLNAYAERFVRSIKEECLDQMIFFGESSLRNAIDECLEHYHRERLHQGLGNHYLESKGYPETPTPPHPSNVASDSADFCVHITVGQRNPFVSVE